MRIDIFMHNVHSIMELIFVQYRNSSGASGSSWYLWWVTTLLTTFFHTRCLGLFLLELKRHQEKLLKNTTTQAHPQRTITTFFNPITPTNATSRSRDTQSSSNNYTFTSCHKIYSQLYDAQLTTGVNYVCI